MYDIMIFSLLIMYFIPILHTRCDFPGRVKILLKYKADCTIANKKKELPLHRACGSSNNIEVGVARVHTHTHKKITISMAYF